MASCSSSAYTGRRGPASVSGTCSDNAGNVGTGLFSFKYDATAPGVGSLRVKPGKRIADLSWRTTSDTVLAEVARSPGAKGAAETVVYRGAATSYRHIGLRPGAGTDTPLRCTARPLTEQVRHRVRRQGRAPQPGAGRTCQIRTVTRLDGDPWSVLLQRGAGQGAKGVSAWPSEPRLQLNPDLDVPGTPPTPAAGPLPLVRLGWVRPTPSRTFRSGAGRQHLHRHPIAGVTRATLLPTRGRPRPSAPRAER
jgi:hypothetical protein